MSDPIPLSFDEQEDIAIQHEIDEQDKETDSLVSSTTETVKEVKKSTGFGWVSTAVEKVKDAIISRETRETFSLIENLIRTFFSDFPYNGMDLGLGLLVLEEFYKSTKIRTEETVESLETMEELMYYMKFASACYGWKLIYGIIKKQPKKFLSSMVGDAANINALCAHTGISEKDVVTARWTSALYNPGHYIAVVPSREKIIVAFRGTFHIRDALVDLVATPSEFMEGRAHTGILRASTQKLQVLTPIILETYQKYPSYEIVVVGHSLGAGVASLFTILFNTAYPEIPIHCYAYAPPSVLSLELAVSPQAMSHITSIVYRDDIVPRLSIGTMNHLKVVMMNMLSQETSTFQRWRQWTLGGNQSEFRKKIAAILKEQQLNFSDLYLFPPGKVYQMYRCDKPFVDGATTATEIVKEYAMELSSPALFVEIIISDTMFGDHMPNKYEDRLEGCIQTMKKWKCV